MASKATIVAAQVEIIADEAVDCDFQDEIGVAADRLPIVNWLRQGAAAPDLPAATNDNEVEPAAGYTQLSKKS